jgi:carbon monoxide dehydrogenase subunit G
LIHRNPEEVYNLFSDLTNLKHLLHKLPADKIQDLEYTADTCSFSISPVGKVEFRVTERIPFERIRFAAENAPVDIDFRIDLLKQQENETVCQIVAEADLNPFIKAMVAKPVQEVVDKIAESLPLMFK